MDIDPTRTAPPLAAGDGPDDWARYALAANVMFIRTPEAFVPLTDDLPFERWIDEGHELGFPSGDDLSYHLTTLFPPVRPRGRLELRMFDMLPEPWWRAAAVVGAALLNDADTGAAAWEAAAGTELLWTEAARFGLGHPLLADAAKACFTFALDAADRTGCDVESARAFFDRFVARGRSPADDRLLEFTTTGELYPSDDTVEAM
jgi:glutamate--cysteine ligase